MRTTTTAAAIGVLLLLAQAVVASAYYVPAVVLAPASVSGSHLEISPDGNWAVFVDDLDATGELQLYSAALDGADTPTVRRLSTLLDADGDVSQFRITPDSTRVVYRGDLRADGVYELFSAPIDTEGQQIRLSNDGVGGGDVTAATFRVTPDSSRVVYTGDLRVADRVELFSAPVDAGGQQQTLSLNLPPVDGDVTEFALTSDGIDVVFRGDQRQDGRPELFSTRADGSSSVVVLNDDVTPGGEVDAGWVVSSDDVRVVYTGDLRVDGTTEVFSAPVGAADGQVRLNDDPVGGGAVTDVLVTPDATRVVWQGDVRVDDTLEIFSTPIAGGSQLRLSANDPVTDGDASTLLGVAPDSSRVVYSGDLDVNGDVRVRSAPVGAGGGEVVLSDEPVSGGFPGGLVVFTSDSARVLFTGDLDAHADVMLYSAPIAQSGQQVALYDGAVAGSVLATFQLAPDDSRVAFVGDFRVDDVTELWSAPVDGSAPAVRLHDAPPAGGDALSSIDITADSTRVIHFGDLRADGALELYSTPLAGGTASPLIGGGPVAGSGVTSYRVSADSSIVVLSGDQQVNGQSELYVSGVGQAPPGAPTDLAVSAVTDTGATVTWAAPVDSTRASSYEVATDPPSTTRRVAVDGDTTSLVLDGLEPDTDYEVTVVASNGGGDGPAATADFTTDGTTDDPTDDPTDGPTDGPTDDPTPEPGGVFRLAGDDRYATAADVALERFEPSAVGTVLLATGTNFPDALSGGPLAAALGAPILLVEPGALPTVTEDALAALDPDRVVALGGTVAVGNDVLAAAGVAGSASTDRIAGDDRYATATAIADALGDAGGDLTRAYLAIGTNFPDAVAAGPVTDGAPILLTDGASLSTATGTWLAGATPSTVTAVGGEVVLQPAVLSAAVDAAGDATPARLAGDNRYLTATAIADTLGTGSDAPDTIYVAVGTNFPDALTGGPAAAAESAAIVLAAGGADALPTDTAAWLDALSGLRRVVVIGGEAVITPAVADELATLLD